MSAFEFRSPVDQRDIDGLIEILIESFRFERKVMGPWTDRIGRENLRVVCHGPRITACLAILPVGQWFGGKLLPMGAIAAVGVVPDARGSGVGRVMMEETLRELHGRGTPLSALYASTQRLYRRVGYEQAGIICRYSAPARAFPSGERGLAMQPLDLDDLGAAKTLRHEYGRSVNGFLERNEAMWLHAARPFRMESRAYSAGDPARPEGLILLRRAEAERGFHLDLKDLLATTPRGMARLCTFLSDHRSTVDRVRWDGGPADPGLLLLPEQEYRVDSMERFLVRIVDVPAALAGRGYAGHLDETLELAVEDPLIPENSGHWTLRVEDGAGTVTAGGAGELRVGIRELAPLYTGLHPAPVLARLGQLDGTGKAIATADRIFSGPTPTMADRF